MASENKMRKLKNSLCQKAWLKNKTTKLKRLGFYNASKRAEDKRVLQKLLPEQWF